MSNKNRKYVENGADQLLKDCFIWPEAYTARTNGNTGRKLKKEVPPAAPYNAAVINERTGKPKFKPKKSYK